MYDDRPHMVQWFEPRRRAKSAAKVAEEASRQRALARGAKGDAWNGLLKPFLLSVLAIVAFLVAMGVANAFLTGAP